MLPGLRRPREAPCPRGARAPRRRRSRPSRPIRQARARERADRVSPADHGEASSFAATASATARVPSANAAPFEDAHGAVPEDRLRARDLAGETRPRLGADVEREPGVGISSVRRLAFRRSRRTRSPRDDVDRQLDVELERVLARAAARPSCRRSARCRHARRGSGARRACRRPWRRRRSARTELDVAEQPAELIELLLEQQPRVRRQQCATASVDACARCAEPNASLT